MQQNEETVIEVKNFSKLYSLGEVGMGTLSNDLKRWWAGVRGKEDPFAEIGTENDRTKAAGKDEHVWALQNISFDVQKGDVLGIIGKNGSGKSTLLKLLSKITAPTTGYARIKGRVASLLEVGTGMHPEMTGRENVYLNGTILGMTKKEIDSKLEEIMEFAGCLKYADTPVKRYSSGMKVRLGFAVAAFLEPEILIVDEVLAVGDAEFQKKAIGKMKDISSGGGRTVLFVSHNMASIQSLCTKAVLLSNGQVDKVGTTDEVVEYYLTNFNTETTPYYKNTETIENEQVWVDEIHIEHQGKKVNKVLSGQDIDIMVNYKAKETGLKCSFFLGVYDHYGDKMLHLGLPYGGDESFLTKEEGELRCHIPKLPLPEGDYSMNFSLHLNSKPHHRKKEALGMVVEFGDFYGNGKLPAKSVNKFLINQKWDVQ